MGVKSDAEMQIAAKMAAWDMEEGQTVWQYMDLHSGEKTVEEARAIIQNNNIENCYNWRVQAVADDNNVSGMYGVMIDEGNGCAIFSFRGSEDREHLLSDKFTKDWIAADGGLLDSTATYEQIREREFVAQMYREYGNDFDEFGFAGFSLGGNLAVDAAINAPLGMKSKITQVYGFDSPGFSQEYWIAHAPQILLVKDKIKHFQWTPVGALFDTPCATNTIVELNDNTGGTFAGHDLFKPVLVNGTMQARNGGLMRDELLFKALVFSADIKLPVFRKLATLANGVTRTLQLYYCLKNGGKPVNIVQSGGTIRAEFEVNIPALQYLDGQYANIETRIKQAYDTLKDIESNLKYNSNVGFLYKYRIKEAANRMERYAQRLTSIRDVLQTASSEYQAGDYNARNEYAIV